ncbi:MAG: hypothetical protein KUG53_04395 [Pseudomonadales bacterium]|nr:hypothetical protein [Pseudomonadales bacterium]
MNSGTVIYHITSQAVTVFLPVKSVGVVGDARRYEYMTASSFKMAITQFDCIGTVC